MTTSDSDTYREILERRYEEAEAREDLYKNWLPNPVFELLPDKVAIDPWADLNRVLK